MTQQPTSTRVARCSCGRTKPSTPDLPFLVTAEEAVHNICVCGYHRVAHEEPTRSRPHMLRTMSDGHDFTQRPVGDFDRFYCGHAGWD